MRDVKVLGMLIGKADRRGDNTNDRTTFVNFLPAKNIKLPGMGEIEIDYIEGMICHWEKTDLIATYRINMTGSMEFLELRKI